MNKESNSDGQEEKRESKIRIWVCSWNMAAKSHFPMKMSEKGVKHVDTTRINELENIEKKKKEEISVCIYIYIKQIYVFGVQEGIDDGYFDLLSAYFKDKKIKRFKISPKKDRVEGRGDGSFLNSKYTGIAVYINKDKKDVIRLKRAGAVSAGMMEGSKGGAGIVLKQKREHYKVIVEKAGAQLGQPNFQLLEQFHHVVWFGDLNYRLKGMTGDEVTHYKKIQCLNEYYSILFFLQKIDTLKEEMGQGQAFASFREPIPRLDFYPTYKKRPDRDDDFDEDPLQVAANPEAENERKQKLANVYRIKFKVPFYKGGSVQDRLPSFTDRVLSNKQKIKNRRLHVVFLSIYTYVSVYVSKKKKKYHSLLTTDGQLRPENDIGILSTQSRVYKRTHNYGCVSQKLKGSDHSAVYCGFLLTCPVLRQRPQNELDEKFALFCFCIYLSLKYFVEQEGEDIKQHMNKITRTLLEIKNKKVGEVRKEQKSVTVSISRKHFEEYYEAIHLVQYVFEKKYTVNNDNPQQQQYDNQSRVTLNRNDQDQIRSKFPNV
ncbi:hypothetical protein RFI_05243 [Reticulomyxa filosa]|uniref:Inositol polyphosphate-related phosphatase domain-containing protein n=1 Tax=Reticulomyxa filosa TaxID=46433 RepID=X6P1E3_RETFI|nr:hypothetical protein RFI_05243 [Reticulomyxa filosa]|eukprot:ETO31874.1 hypothetical protein RFI_05243 [Reticulomyxa filosa]